MTSWLKDAFFQVATHPKQISTGPMHVPVRYFDASSLIAFFMVDYAKASALVNVPGIEVVQMTENKALFALAFYEYRSLTDGAPYNEVGACIVVQPTGMQPAKHPLMELSLPPDRRQTGMHILHLPVTTQDACAAGCELWGYPKFVTAINFNLSDKEFTGQVMHPDNPQAPLLSLTGKLGMGLPAPWADLVLYSSLNDQLIRATANTRTLDGATFATAGSLKLSLDLVSGHPMAETLNRLDLDGTSPISATYTHSLQLRLNEGVVVETEADSTEIAI